MSSGIEGGREEEVGEEERGWFRREDNFLEITLVSLILLFLGGDGILRHNDGTTF